MPLISLIPTLSIDEDEMWSDLVKVLEEEVGEKMPTPTRFQTIKWTIEDFFQRLWWDIEDYFNPTR